MWGGVGERRWGNFCQENFAGNNEYSIEINGIGVCPGFESLLSSCMTLGKSYKLSLSFPIYKIGV